MDCLRASLTAFAVFGLSAVFTSEMYGEDRCCEYCGCQQHLKRVCKLVVACKETAIPTYECSPTEVFCPDKGIVCHTEYRCDAKYRLATHYDYQSVPGCGCSCETKISNRTICCTCTAHGGCTTLHGAKPTGCLTDQGVERPTGKCTTELPVPKWVVIHVCEDCCHRAKGRH